MERERVVVTGLGSVNGLANNVADLWSGLIENQSAIRVWQEGKKKGIPVSYAAAIDWVEFQNQFSEESILNASMERRTAFGAIAGLEAVRDAGLSEENILSRMGVITGSGVPQRDEREDLLAYSAEGYNWQQWWVARQKSRRNTGTFCSNDHLAILLAKHLGLHGPVLNVSSACAGAAQAIGLGFRSIRRGETPLMLVGGADSVLNTMTMVGLNLLGAPSTKETLAEKLCRPFDTDRSGLVAGEGGAMVVLESLSHARARGAQIHAEVVGYGSSLDAYKITAPHPEGKGQAHAMASALRDAKLVPNNVDYINAHGTSTPLNDVAETLAIKKVFSASEHFKRLSISSIKAHIGHLIAAAGAGEFVATVLSAKHQYVPATLNLELPGQNCDLDYVPNFSRKKSIRYAISNSFGFGGLNASLVVAPYKEGI